MKLIFCLRTILSNRFPNKDRKTAFIYILPDYKNKFGPFGNPVAFLNRDYNNRVDTNWKKYDLKRLA